MRYKPQVDLQVPRREVRNLEPSTTSSTTKPPPAAIILHAVIAGTGLLAACDRSRAARYSRSAGQRLGCDDVRSHRRGFRFPALSFQPRACERDAMRNGVVEIAVLSDVGYVLCLPPEWVASATPIAVSAIPARADGPSVSPNSGHAINAVQGGTRKKRLATSEAAPRRIST